MPVCVGIAQTKTLSQLANHIAKKSQRVNGACVLDIIDPWKPVVSKISVNKVWGVGSKTAQKLKLINVVSILDLLEQNPKNIRNKFGITLERTVRELNGERCISLETQPKPKQEIYCSRSFGHKVNNLRQLNESVANYAVRASKKLRRQHSLTQRVYVTIQTSRFNEDHYNRSSSIPLPHPTNDSRTIVKAATSLCHQIYREGYLYARVGVGLLDLTESTHHQYDLLTQEQHQASKLVMGVIDQINQKYGDNQVFLAAQGIPRKRQWNMSRDFKSPAYTTRINDIPVVKI
jgi:DNA polymerase V